MPDPNNKKTDKKINTTVGGALLSGKPQGSIVTPFTTLTTKIAGAIGSLFGKPTAANRPGVDKPVATSYISSSSITPVSGAPVKMELRGMDTTKALSPKAYRAKMQTDYAGWRPTSFESIVGGFSGIRNTRNTVQTGVFAGDHFATFRSSGPTSLRQLKPGEKITSTGWDKIAGWSSGGYFGTDKKIAGYSLRKNRTFGSSSQAGIFKNIITSQAGGGTNKYTTSSNLFKYGSTGGVGSVSHGTKRYSDVGTGKSLFIRNYNAPNFLHNTLSGISKSIKSGSPTYDISTSSGTQTRKTESHALSADYEVYKSYMDTYFSSTGKLGGGYTTEKPSQNINLFTDSRRSGLGVSEYGYSNMIKIYNQRTKSGKIPTISQYSLDKVGYDILKAPNN